MIPLRLHIKNFISYGPLQEISFEPYQLICLSGKNGHGKSALLDAMTWVLWGQARKVAGTAKADESLLKLGQDHMFVCLDFMVQGITYRVRREYTAGQHKSFTNLEFGIYDAQTDTIRPLTDKTIRATQSVIESTIGLSYEGFINSAFLRQGHSNEFSKKTAKERKEILAAILGLDHFEKLRETALDRTKQLTLAQTQIQSHIRQIELELQQKESIDQQATIVNEQLAAVSNQEEAIKNTLLQIKESLEKLRSVKQRALQIEFEKKQIEQTIGMQTARLCETARHWRSIFAQQRTKKYEQLQAERDRLEKQLKEIQIIAAQKIELREQYLGTREKLHTFVLAMQNRLKQSEEQIIQATAKLSHELNAATEKKQVIEKNKTQIQADIITVSATLNRLGLQTAPTDADIAQSEKKLDRQKSYYHTFTSLSKTIKTILETTTQKKELICANEQPNCPLCTQPADKEMLLAVFSMQESKAIHQLRRLTSILQNLKDRITKHSGDLERAKLSAEQARMAAVRAQEAKKQLQQNLATQQELETTLQQLEIQVGVLKEQEKKISQDKQMHATQVGAISADPGYVLLHSQLQTLEVSIKAIPDHQETEKKVRTQLDIILQLAEEYKALIHEVARQAERKKSVSEMATEIRLLKKQLSAFEQLPSSDALNAEEQKNASQESAAADSLQLLASQKEKLLQERGSIQSMQNQLQHKEQECIQHKKELEKYVYEIQQYTTLANAFSKDGIQALLIEQAIPEIEEEANRLLARLTDNQSHLSIESIRDLKSGKMKETLDIKISDAVGIRPYELFSGGEAFRIDFSLRIAIAKLLARRAGTALQTLIIDEGFGSQDEEGLSHIMEAIYAIQDDFAKIIIVSHLPALKEQFPVHFTVTKSSQGSSIEITEHC